MAWPLFTAPVAFLAAWLFDRRRRVYADLGTTPTAAVSAGRNEVKGRAWHETPLRSHLTRTPCVWWTYLLEEEREHTRTVTNTDSKGRTTTRTEKYRQWHEIDSKASARLSAQVVDDSGAVEVMFAGAAISPESVVNNFRAEDRRGFLEKLASFDNRTGCYRETERIISIGDDLFVVGEASMPADADVPRIDHGKPFVISIRTEESHRNRAGIAVPTFLAIGLGLTVLGASGFDHTAVVPAAVGAALLLIVSGATLVVFNRLQLLVQQAARAWSLIDVQLTRRHDLIPSLEAIATAAVEHERTTLEAVTVARSPRAGSPPDQETVDEADQEVRRQTDRINALLVVIEAYPDLKTGDAMRRLQHDLADTENRIAGTRTFYNEAVTLLRNRRGTFPGLLVARFADPRRFALFGADEFERTVPTITYDFDDREAA